MNVKEKNTKKYLTTIDLLKIMLNEWPNSVPFARRSEVTDICDVEDFKKAFHRAFSDRNTIDDLRDATERFYEDTVVEVLREIMINM